MKIIDVPQTGKLGLTVTWPGRNGLIRRQWVAPANPKSPEQLVVRSILANQAKAYKALAEAKQDAWVAAAALQRSKPSLGQSGPLTGLQLFVRINANLVRMGNAPVDTPPAVPVFQDLAPSALVITNLGGVITLKLTCPSDPGENTVLSATAPQGGGTRRAVSWRELGTCPAPADGAATITGLYAAKFGMPTVGSRVFVEAKQIIDGYEGLPKVFSALVPSAD